MDRQNCLPFLSVFGRVEKRRERSQAAMQKHFFGKADKHRREARAAALVWRYCNALKHAECNI